MVQPAPRMMRLPARNRRPVPMTVVGGGMVVHMGAARKVDHRHGKKR